MEVFHFPLNGWFPCHEEIGRIRQMLLDNPLVYEGHEFKMRVSIGVAV